MSAAAARPAAGVRQTSGSQIERLLAVAISLTGLPKPEREYRFHPTRKWRIDFAWPDLPVQGLPPARTTAALPRGKARQVPNRAVEERLMTTELYTRSCETAKKIGGVRTNPDHWASSVVHAFHEWTGDSTLITWCGIDVDLKDKGKQTTDLINCLQCGRESRRVLWASWQAV